MNGLTSTAPALPLSVPVAVPAAVAVAPRLSVVIVNYRQWPETARLVRQLRRSRAFRGGVCEVLIVDNHSPPHPLAARLRRTDGVSLRRWGRNRGFARAVNEGMRLSRGRWVLLLNSDVSVARGFLDKVLRLTARLEREEPQVGVVGLGLRNQDGSRQRSAGPFPTLAGTLLRLLLPRAWRKHHLWRGGRGGAVGWVTGCGLLARRQVFDELGGLDPDFFLYYEDVDFCRRAREHGWAVHHEPVLTAVHHHPLHSRKVSPLLRLLTRHALLTYAGKHWPRWQVRLLARVVRVEAWLKRRLALRRGDAKAAGLFDQLGRLAEEMRGGWIAAAGRRLARVVQRRDQ